MGQPDGLTLAEWLSVAVLAERERAAFLRTLAAAMPEGQALLDLADWIDRDIAAKWAILARHRPVECAAGVACEGCGYTGDLDYPRNLIDECPELRDLATVYADRDGYDPSWRPDGQ